MKKLIITIIILLFSIITIAQNVSTNTIMYVYNDTSIADYTIFDTTTTFYFNLEYDYIHINNI